MLLSSTLCIKDTMKPCGVCALMIQLFLAAGVNTGWKSDFGHSLGKREEVRYSYQMIVAMENDPVVMESATYLFLRDPSMSTLLRYHEGALQVLRGSSRPSGRNHNIMLVGHGSQGPMEAAKLAGYGPDDIAKLVTTIKAEILSGDIGTVTIISCSLGNDEHFMLKLLQVLHSARVETKLHLHTSLLSVNSDGEIVAASGSGWRVHDHSSTITAELLENGILRTVKELGCAGPILSDYKGKALYLQMLEWPSHPQMFVPADLRKKYSSIDCLEGLTWSLFFEETEKRRAPDYTPNHGQVKAVWLKEIEAKTIVPKHINNILDLLVEIRYNAREEVSDDLYYVLNDCIYKVQNNNLSISLVGKFMRMDNEGEVEEFVRTFSNDPQESSLLELQQGLKASKFTDFCRQTFQLHHCIFNCERWGKYFMAAVFSASVRNFRTFSLFLMSVIGCEVGRSRGSDSPLCTSFIGENHPMVTKEPWPENPRRGFYGCTVDNYETAPQKVWLEQVVAKENALYFRSREVMNALHYDEQTELDIFGRVKVMNKYVFSSYLDYFRGTPEGKKLKSGCPSSLH
ncbi:uncharacterized protein LOC105355132 isoform X2 [Oryzias latipes]|uniref:uncharacterized protein LOC105355132 isoform X2 n=1 Tax=Oryzias latipes TaxID=8090 RepID=UPI0005CC378D|nr:uncharacterized protein LOC105355132 isoform X2 [Oryzias latipes]